MTDAKAIQFRDKVVASFTNRQELFIDGKYACINTLQHEDGSGLSFNLTLSDKRCYYLNCRKQTLIRLS